MPDHPFHLKIGTLVRGLCLPSIREIWIDPACDPDSPGVITLFHGTGPDRVRFCLVDILITQPNKVVIIEIEESDVKPLHLFGKFFASVHSTHHRDTDISKLPLLFIQVLLEPERTRKGEQWDCIEQILKGNAENWQGRRVEYELARGKSADFEDGGKEGQKLLDLASRFLGSNVRATQNC